MKRVSLGLILVLSLVLLFACGSSKDLSGKYLCTDHFTKSMVGMLTLNFQKDGVVLVQPLKREGTYSLEDGVVNIDLELFDLTLNVKEDKLVSDDGRIVFEKQ